MKKHVCLHLLQNINLENKKTDAVTNQDKMNTWEKVAREFNSLSPGNVQRPTGVLKRFYENKKKELRKRCANIKMHIRGTGGGPPLLEEDKHPTDDLLLSIINEKTVYGMNPPFGGDVDSKSEVENEADRLTAVLNNKIELVYDQSSKPDSSVICKDMELEHVNTPELESTESLTGTATSQENNKKTWASYTPSDLSQKVSSPLKRKISKVLSQSQEENIPGPSTIEKTPKNSSRRRPAVVVKSLTSSGIAAKYDKLLDCRLEIVAYEKKELEQRIQQNVTKHEKEMLLLDIQLEMEREKLKRIKRSDCQ